MTRSGSLLLRLLVNQFDSSPGWLLESCRSLWRVLWTVLVDTSWALASFMTLSCWSFSTLAAILAMKTFGEISLIRCRRFSFFAFWWPLTAAFSSRPCHGRFLTISWVLLNFFLAVASDFMNLLWRVMRGGKIGYHQIGERLGERAETKAFENRECQKNISPKGSLANALQNMEVFLESCKHTCTRYTRL